MPKFRKRIPRRRNVVKIARHYSEHRKNLKEDFNHRCGYCDSHDGFRRAHYEIDHFIPKKYLKETFTKPEEYKDKEQEYSNLVYACRSCNNAKRNKWPTKSMDVCHKDNVGFIDPCKSEYDDQFDRKDNGEIIAITELGKWIYKELNLSKPEHRIIWLLDEINKTIHEIEKMIINKPAGNRKKLEEIHYKLLLNYHKFHNELMEY